tara:strand:- start:1642 stop:2508 length:867 start_codon:yes stop_codon:yes gene_type:complete
MNHQAELSLHQYLQDAVSGKSSMSDDTIKQVAADVADAMQRQFGSGKSRGDFTLRMSNVGRPTCQLWYDKNKPEAAIPLPTTFVMNMMLGDIVEAVFKGLLREAGVKYEDTEKVTLDTGSDNISGSYDLIIDGAVDDIKSASDWSYRNKFDSYESLADKDGFGYVPQLAGYAKATAKRAGGWWVINKANGKFKYLPASGLNVDEEINKIKQTISKVKENKFERCFEPVPETFRGKPTGNKVLNDGCKFCSYRFDCWDSLIELPAVKSQAKNPPTVAYVELTKEYRNGD